MFRQWTQKRHPIPHPYGWAMGHLFLVFWRKDTTLTRYRVQCIHGAWYCKHKMHITVTSHERVSLHLKLPAIQLDGLVQDKRNSIANALELRLSCTNLWICLFNSLFRLTSKKTSKLILLCHTEHCDWSPHIGGLVQERHNSIANALELCLSCANPSICLFNNLLRLTTKKTPKLNLQCLTGHCVTDWSPYICFRILSCDVTLCHMHDAAQCISLHNIALD